jgi:hypothetical protein
VWSLTNTPPQIHRYASCIPHNRANSRALPTPSLVAYSHNPTRIFGSIAGRPGSFSRAAIGS